MKKEKVAHRIAAKLLQQIKQGDWKPGNKLPTEKQLSESFQVSRASIREALSELRAQGVISSKQGGGSYVEAYFHPEIFQQVEITAEDRSSFRHLFEMRKILEPEAASIAAARRTDKELAEMEAALRLMEEDAAAGTIKGQEADFAFHLAVIKATHNPVMIQSFANLDTIYKQSLMITLKERQKKDLQRSRQIVQQEHVSIYQAIKSGEAELARLQCLIHLRNVEEQFYAGDQERRE